uniref:RING-type E3 ubiquitin transferase n=1 Tax=Caenorhabditis japonica TaxID=281687 RepID=A0A8R1DP29_CAEJA
MQSVAPHIPIVGAGADDSSAEILSVFECPVCLEYMLPPYMQCPSGHLVCSNCRPKLQCCPTCRGPTREFFLDLNFPEFSLFSASVRNLGLEKIANTVRFPCRFSNSGCPLNFHHIDKIEHEELCEYRPYSCPCPGASCKWQGALSDVMDHLKRVHKSITTLQGEDIVFLATDINLPGAVDWVMMQSCFDYNFMLVLGESILFKGCAGENASKCFIEWEIYEK